MAGHDGITIINPDKEPENGIISNYAYFPIIIDESITQYTRDDLFEELQNHNIFTRKYFYPLITDFECYQDRFSAYELPVAHYVADHVLTLPMYADLADDDVRRICEVITNFGNEDRR
ncbi:dTDP-4-amino-4,6-dideoxy-D-glucose transaminase [bioreactor metagenome]|uniref:dTDP-4-amino-4,6-dideoxy-D-glucose transaminase n=1 Tax=bioreactor metagenome TaxID=1076179 RepID=A0A645EG00_9ZZZZ